MCNERMCDFTKETAQLILRYLEAQSWALKLAILQQLRTAVERETIRIDRAAGVAVSETIELELSYE